MRPTPLTDAAQFHITISQNPDDSGVWLVDSDVARKLERLLREARDVIAQARPDDFDDPTVIETTLARIDATLDSDCLEGSPRTREERAADARALDEVAPTPADKFALMFGMPNPDYVEALMEVSVTTIDPATGEVKQDVARSDEELRTLLDDERDVDAFPEAHRADPFDDDLDEPLPPKQCGIDDPDCESCQ